MDDVSKAIESLGRTHKDAIELIATAMNQFGGLTTGRHCRRRVVIDLCLRGIAKSVGPVNVRDDFGILLDPPKRKEGFRLTEFGERCHAAILKPIGMEID